MKVAIAIVIIAAVFILTAVGMYTCDWDSDLTDYDDDFFEDDDHWGI